MEIISKYIISGKTGLQSTSELLSKKKFELVKSHQIGLQQLESVKTAYYSKLAELFCQLEIQFQDAIQQSQDNLKSPEENYTQCSDKVHLVEKSLGEGDLDIRTMELLFESVLQIEEIVSMIQAVKNPTLRTLLCRLGIQDIGYLETDGVEPADFILVLETEQAEAVVGAQINLSINSRTSKELNESCLEKFKVSTKSQTWIDESSEVEVNSLLLADGHSKIIFSFLPQKGGMYTVSVCLYEQHISGSPCTLPLCTVQRPSHVQQPSHVQLSPVKCDSSTSTPIKANPGSASTSGGVPATESGDVSCSSSSTTKAYPGVSNAGRRLLSSTLNKSLSFNKKLEDLNETKIPEGKDEDVSMSGANAAQVHSKHSEEASSSRLPEIVSPVAVVSTDQVDSEIVSPVAVVSTDQVDSSAPLVDDSFGGARPKTSLSRSDSETSSPGVSVLLPGTKVLARSSSKTWNTGTIVKEVKKERFLVEFPDSVQETIKQKYIVTSIQDVPADGVVHSQAFSRFSKSIEGMPAEISSIPSDLQVGEHVIARWNMDQTWHKAEILKIEKNACTALFTSYGNQDVVNNVVRCVDLIPKEDFIDEHVLLTKPEPEHCSQETHTAKEALAMAAAQDIGATEEKDILEHVEFVLAKWTEDNTWYRAQILTREANSCTVIFYDYGNADSVARSNIVLTASNIPAADLKDENIESQPTDIMLDIVPSEVISSHETQLEKIIDPSKEHIELESQTYDLKEGDLVLAKWTEDSTWYRAQIQSTALDTVTVLFYDYGNADIVDKASIVHKESDIPAFDLKDEILTSEIQQFSKDSTVAVDSTPNSSSTTEAQESKNSEVLSSSETPVSRVPIDKDSLQKQGNHVFAKWGEDQTWYRAIVTSLSEDKVSVLFIDYGNTDTVDMNSVHLESSSIPELEEKDENVYLGFSDVSGSSTDQCSPTSPLNQQMHSYKAGDKVFAQWSEDVTWYRALVTGVVESKYNVLFIDYGNKDVVTPECIRTDRQKIPSGDSFDENLFLGLHFDTALEAGVPMQLQFDLEKETEPDTESPKEVNNTLKVKTSVTSKLQVKADFESKPPGNKKTPPTSEIKSPILVNSNVNALNSSTQQFELGFVMEKVEDTDCFNITFFSADKVEIVHANNIRNLDKIQEEAEENLDEFISVADLLPKDKDVADPPGKDEGVADISAKDEDGADPTEDEDSFLRIFLNHHDKELKSSGGLSANLKLKNLYLELEKWNTGDIGFQGTVQVVVQKRSANCLIVELLDGSIKSVSPFTISSILVEQAVKPESKYADALDYTSDESNSSESEVSSPRIPGTRLLIRLEDGLYRPIGVAADSSYVYIVCKDSQSIRKFTKRGDFVKEYLEYPKPRQLLHLKQGGFVLTCKKGLVFLTPEFTRIKVVEGKYSGIAQDDSNRIITLVERKRETDQQIAVINSENYVIESKIMVSKVNSCKWITYDRGSLYLSCPGLHKVVKVNMDGRILGEMVSLDSEDPVNTEYEFAVVKMDPAEVVVLDSSGTMLVADSKNNRVQVYNAEYECLGSLDIPEMSLGPCGMHLDTLNRILYLTCHWSNSTLVLQLVQF